MASQQRVPGSGDESSRPCPAIGGSISSADCGSQRGSELDCPPTCEHYPFGVAGYGRLLEVEARWFRKALARVALSPGAHRLHASARELRDDYRRLRDECLMHVALRKRDGSGTTGGERWADEGWVGLDHDERLFAEHWLHGFATVIELDRVASDRETQCIDLLAEDGVAFTVFEPNLAREVRFTRFLVLALHFRHLSRLLGSGFVIDPKVWPAWRERLRERSHDRGISEREFVTDHFLECSKWITEIERMQRDQFLTSIQFHQCVARWSVAGSMAEVAGVLSGLPDFAKIEDAGASTGFPRHQAFYGWLKRGESEALEEEPPSVFRNDRKYQGVGVVGSVRLYPDYLTVETFSKQKHEFARKMIARWLGARVRFESERFDDIAQGVLNRVRELDRFHDAVAEAGGPARSEADDSVVLGANDLPIEVRRAELRADHERRYRTFLEDRIPALDGLTPGEAARDARMRPRLVELMKGHVHDIEQIRRREGVELDIDWVLAALGLGELSGARESGAGANRGPGA